jgi:drug/metabolite transporter (DMT)-like permease
VNTPHRRAIVLALIVTALWSSSWVIIRFGLDDEGLRPLTFAGVRYLIAGLVLLGACVIGPRTRQSLRSVRGRELLFLAGFGLVIVAVAQGGQFVAIANQPAATTSLVLSFTPLLVVAASGRSLDEWATIPQVLGAVLVVSGAFLYFFGALEATLVGMTAAVVALLGNSVGAVMNRGVHRSGLRSPLITTGVSMTVGAIVLVIAGLILEGWPTFTTRGVAFILWLALVNGSLAWWMWNLSLRHLTATESSVIGSLMLVLIAGLSWIFLAERPSAIQIVGIVLVTAGISWSQVRRRRPSPSGVAGSATGK